MDKDFRKSLDTMIAKLEQNNLDKLSKNIKTGGYPNPGQREAEWKNPEKKLIKGNKNSGRVPTYKSPLDKVTKLTKQQEIMTGGPMDKSVSTGKKIAKTVIQKIQKPGYSKVTETRKIKIKKSLDSVIKQLEEKCDENVVEKGGPGSGRKTGQRPMKTHWEASGGQSGVLDQPKLKGESFQEGLKHRLKNTTIKKSLDEIRLEDVILLKSEKMIDSLEEEPSEKVSDSELVKGFGSIENIPANLMKAENRPPAEWWASCIMKAEVWAGGDVCKECNKIWTGEEDEEEEDPDLEKMVEKVKDWEREPEFDEGGESQVSGDPTKANIKDLKPYEKDITG